MSNIVNNFQQKLSELTLTPFLYLVAAILFIILALCFYYYYVKPNYLEPTYTANKEHLKETSKQPAELLFFYASWCPHSKVAKPIFDDLKASLENTTINGYQVIYTLVDCSSETDEVEKMTSKYSVEGYPTFKLQKDGKIIEYDAKPSRETLEQFLSTVL